MSKNLEVKEQAVSEIKEKLEKATSLVLVDYKGINVEAVTELRKRCREAGVDYKVYKNTLFKRAAAAANVEGLDSYMEGTVAVAFGYGDVVAPAKTMNQFIKDHPKTTIAVKGGLVEGKVMDEKSIKALGDLPSREILLSMLLSGLTGNLRNLAYALDQIRVSKEA